MIDSTVRSQLSARARASAASPSRWRSSGSISTLVSATSNPSSGASRPVTPSTTLDWWPLMSVATAGVAQAAPSVNDRPQPSASEALDTTHACW